MAEKDKPVLKRRLSVDEQDKMPVVAQPQSMDKSQLAINFGLVGVSCTCAQATVHWTQTTMVRQQLAAMAGGEKLAFPAQLSLIAREEGIRGLYRGFSAAALREMSYSTLRFGLYEPLKIALGGGGKDAAAWKNVTAGLAAGTVAAAIASPTDMLTIRMMQCTGEPLGLAQTARSIVAESGLRGLYRGIDTTMTRAAILGGTKMGTYDTVKQQLRTVGWTDGASMIFTASILTGLATTITTSPATNARTMIMASPPGTYNGMLDCLGAIVRSQGPLGLFTGFAAQWLRFGPYAVVQFTVWELLRSMCGIKPI